MDHFHQIYDQEAENYHRLIAAEDADGNLVPALKAIADLAGKRVLDIGSGTGRIPLLMHEVVYSITGLDRAQSMLQEQQRQQVRVSGQWPLVEGDMGRLPFSRAGFDLTIAGWAVGHLTAWEEEQWPPAAGRVISEMERVTRPGGAMIIIETLGTGHLSPAPPLPALADYYAWLEEEKGFSCITIATDYQFSNLDEAEMMIGFFFGPQLAQEVRANQWTRVPEWTGIWWKQKPS